MGWVARGDGEARGEGDGQATLGLPLQHSPERGQDLSNTHTTRHAASLRSSKNCIA